MQPAQQPLSHRLHWIPVSPSWLVGGALAVLAVMPHRLPRAARVCLRNPIGAILALTGAAWIALQSPVLAVAVVLLVAGVWTMPVAEAEHFIGVPVLNKDVVTSHKKRRWFGEDIMTEEPAVIQERTDAPSLLKDVVGREEAEPWYGESAMDEHPAGIQERAVAWRDYDDDGGR